MLSVHNSQPGVSSPCVVVAEFDAAKVVGYMERIDCAEAEITRGGTAPPGSLGCSLSATEKK